MHSVQHSPAWAACLLAFERELTPQQFATWIRPLACANESGRLRLIAPEPLRAAVGQGPLRRPHRRRWRARRPAKRRARSNSRSPTLATPPAKPPAPAHARARRRRPSTVDSSVDRAPQRLRRPTPLPNRRARAEQPQPDLHVRHRSSPARPTSSRGPPGCRSPSIRRRTTRCSSTAASGSARRI